MEGCKVVISRSYVGKPGTITMIKRIRVERFKNIKDISIDLKPINIIVGSNNSGKSSLLQGIQFGVSVAQTTTTQYTYWNSNKLSTSVSPNQLIYTPINDIYALGYGGTLREGTDREIKFTYDDDLGENIVIKVRKGRNKNVMLELQGEVLGQKFQDLFNPYSVFTPGLAGIPLEEKYSTPAIVRKAIARGDANLYLRNIIHQLSIKEDDWQRFISDLRVIFPELEITVSFDMDVDEFINIQIQNSQETLLPIESSGTGMLQAIQILAYIHLFHPKLLILDEPDSHLHPNNQRLLCTILKKAAETNSVNILISTHSRHIIDALSDDAQILWLQNGEIQSDSTDSISLLLSLGALDKTEKFRSGNLHLIVLTEDKQTQQITTLIDTTQLQPDDYEVWSYDGCTNVDTAIALIAFIAKHAPSTKILIHRDRDFMSDPEIQEYKDKFRIYENLLIYVTEKNDIEWIFLNVNHINELYPQISIPEAEGFINDSINEKESDCLKKYINTRWPIYTKTQREAGESADVGTFSAACREQYLADKNRFSHGKLIKGTVSSRIQRKIGSNPNLVQATQHIIPSYIKVFIENGYSV